MGKGVFNGLFTPFGSFIGKHPVGLSAPVSGGQNPLFPYFLSSAVEKMFFEKNMHTYTFVLKPIVNASDSGM